MVLRQMVALKSLVWSLKDLRSPTPVSYQDTTSHYHLPVDFRDKQASEQNKQKPLTDNYPKLLPLSFLTSSLWHLPGSVLKDQ